MAPASGTAGHSANKSSAFSSGSEATSRPFPTAAQGLSGRTTDMDPSSTRSFFSELTRLPSATTTGGGGRFDGDKSSRRSVSHISHPSSDLDNSPSSGHPRSNSRGSSCPAFRQRLLRFRLACGSIVERPAVQVAVVVLIVLNALLMGVATFDVVTDNQQVARAFDAVDTAFLAVFTVELVLQFLYRFLALFVDPWLVFDFVIVVTSWSLESLQVVRAFRSFRAFRLVTRFAPLRDLITAIGAVMPRIYAIVLLLLLVFYVFAVLFTQLFGHLELSDDYFATLEASLFTCMQFMTLSWSGVTRELMEIVPWAWVPVISFIAVTGFIVFNLIVAVVCDAVSVVDRQARADEAEEKKRIELRKELDEEPEAGDNDDTMADTTAADPADALHMAQSQVWNLTTQVVAMHRRQEELIAAMNALSEQVLSLQDEANEAWGVSSADDSAEYDDDDEDDDSPDDRGGGRESFDGGAGTFQRQIDRVSARLDRLRDDNVEDDLLSYADTPASRRSS